MPAARAFSEVRLVNGSAGDPALYVDYPGSDNAVLFDCGENAALDPDRLGDLEAVFLTHLHVDHFIGFDRVVRANIDRDKTLHVFGPAGTIRKVYQRLTAYEHPFYGFQKCVFRVHDLSPGSLHWADLDTAAHFPEPEIHERGWRGRVVYQNAHLRVEAAFADHTAPCLAYALAEKAGYHADPAKLRAGALRPGGWVGHALRLLRDAAAPETVLEIDGGRFNLGRLAEAYFTRSRGARIAFVTDTLWSDAARPGLVQLAKGAWRLYCDSYYSISERDKAVKYRHMTATHAGELAALAKVDQLILMHFAPRYAGAYEKLLEEARTVFPRVSVDLNGAG